MRDRRPRSPRPVAGEEPARDKSRSRLRFGLTSLHAKTERAASRDCQRELSNFRVAEIPRELFIPRRSLVKEAAPKW